AMDTLIPLQQQILQAASARVRPGGRLVYSTCTLNRKENEKQVSRFLSEHPEFSLVREKTFFPFEFDSDGFYVALMHRDSVVNE
ncbi:MAG: 16S rRNA (cytosine(967)-C(5))-methyltransferase RsmB, partial [Merdibacter sp.]|nr:16S rRNA (cytosine(967)-C(5))-methyltransferase RsmB [Merdibacter sp.]